MHPGGNFSLGSAEVGAALSNVLLLRFEIRVGARARAKFGAPRLVVSGLLRIVLQGLRKRPFWDGDVHRNGQLNVRNSLSGYF